MAARDYANTRYSPLDELEAANANQLEVAWTFSTGLVRGHEVAPRVVGDTMQVVTPYPNVVYALAYAKRLACCARRGIGRDRVVGSIQPGLHRDPVHKTV